MSEHSKAPDLLDPDMPTDQLKLMGGEMTEQEVLTARAFIRAANAKAVDHCNALVAAARAEGYAENAVLREALITIRDKREACTRAVDCQFVAREALNATGTVVPTTPEVVDG